MMVDIHSHILPGIDDGARNIDDSLQLLSIGAHNRVDATVFTPHFNAIDDIDRFISLRDERYDLLKKEARKNEINMATYLGAEVYVDDDIFFARNLKSLAVNKTRYILIEFKFHGLRFEDVMSYIDAVYKMGLVPIIAHPERYEYFQSDYEMVNALASRGILFQLNADSLAGRSGPEEFELAYEMAYKGVASFISSDAHSPYGRRNDLAAMARLFPQDIPSDLLKLMLSVNARHMINDEPLPGRRYGRLEKRRFY